MSLSQEEYAELKRLFAFFSEKYLPVSRVPPESRPLACLEKLEGRSFKQAASGLRQAINDIIEAHRHTNPVVIEQIDRELRNAGLMTLSSLRKKFSRQFRAIYQRGKIRNETEYYLIKGVMDDLESGATDDERYVLEHMMNAFEKAAIILRSRDMGT